MTAFLFVRACAVACLLLAMTARAAAQPSIEALRASVAELSRAAEALERRGHAGALESIAYQIDVAARIERGFATQSAAWRARAAEDLEALRAGRDPFVTDRRGEIVARGYMSPISEVRQGYSIYIPPDYDPARRYPLLVIMHGGSSNGNLFLGVVLGNNMEWETYSQHLWDEYSPRWSPDWIVVAPDGFGQVLWRWMGEQDVLDVIDDVTRHYSVDGDRVVLSGLSNGGLGAYAIGMRHAWRFSLVMAIAGAPSWVQYTGGSPSPDELRLLHMYSGMHLARNSVNTDFRFFHGSRDPGPMRPAYVRQMEAAMREQGLTPNVTWYDFGHDLLYLVHRHGRAYPGWAAVTRERRPAEVEIVSADYRANRQHWISLTRIHDYPRLARARASATAASMTITTEGVLELAVDLRDAPLSRSASEEVTLRIDDVELYRGPRARLGHVLTVHRASGSPDGVWTLGFLPAPDEGRLEKRPGLSGPLTDPYFDGMIHVYGTQRAEHTEALRAAAERGARGWPLWLWQHQQRVIADSEVTDALMARSHLVLYATPGSNSVLERIAPQLPIRVTEGAVVVGSQEHRSAGVGTRFVYPNPAAPLRYVVVQASPTPQGVAAGHNLPDFLPDWVVYDARTTRTRARLIVGRNGHVAAGFFDRFWTLPEQEARRYGRGEVIGGDDGGVLTAPALTESPRDPAPTQGTEGAAGGDPGGAAELHAAAPVSSEAPVAPEAPVDPARERQLQINRALGAPEDFVLPPNVLEQIPAPELPPGVAPPVPRRPRRFLAPSTDPAGVIARRIAREVPTFLNYRAIIPGGQWRTDRRASWQIRAQEDCYTALTEAAVPYRRVTEDLGTPVPSPVELTGPVAGVTFRMLDPAVLLPPGTDPVPPRPPVIISCELATRLPAVAELLRQHAVAAVDILSAHRTGPPGSFHRMGLALDIFSFETDEGATLSVYDHFVETPAHRTCEAPRPRGRAARTLLRIACDLARSRLVSSVLTPNYNEGHRNHFHIDARPDDPRIFVR